MKKVLIVSPHFPPINAPDMQRVRLALPHLRACGWEPTVLAVDPASVEGGVRDPRLEKTFPTDVRVVRVRGIPPKLTRWAGFGSLWLRCAGALRREGARLLATEKFDLVFFSTTQFGALQLGPRWQREFGVPFVVDYQDPWANDYYTRTGMRPPGGPVRYALAQWTARRAEPKVLAAASGIVSVSDSYPEMLARLYSGFDPRRVRVLPFGASEGDFAALVDYRPAKPLVEFGDGLIHHVYAGRIGDDMAFALRGLFGAVRRFRQTHPQEAARLRFHFIGTDYAPPPLGRDWALPVAREEGVDDLVREHRYRVPYFDVLYYLRHADALLAIGSDDPTYSASKIFPYVLARRPLLIVFHCNSLVLDFATKAEVGVRVAFADAADRERVAQAVHDRWFAAGAYAKPATFNEVAFEPYTARALTRELAAVFDVAVSSAQAKR